MPKVEKISHADIYFGMSTFERTSRIDPSTTTTRTMMNARHVPYSGTVSASTVAGGIDVLDAVMSGAVRTDFATNRTAISGIVLSNYAATQQAISGIALSNFASVQQAISGIVACNLAEARALQVGTAGVTGSGWRMDAGNTGWSGWRMPGVSTALSSIKTIVFTPLRNFSWANNDYSGVLAEHISCVKSGHAFSVYRHVTVSGGIVTSGGISGVVSWIAMGI